MAKKQKLDTGDYRPDDDFDFNFDDFGVEDPFAGNPKKKRSPVDQVKDTIKEVTKSSLSVQKRLPNILRRVLPKQYGQALDSFDRNKQSIKQTMQDSVRELRPATNELARNLNNVVPEKHSGIKRLISDLEKKTAGPEKMGAAGSAESSQESAIVQQLTSVFSTQMQVQELERQERSKQQRLDTALDVKRHRESAGWLSSIDYNIQKLAQYTLEVNQQWQKKTLELNIRSYYVQAEMLNLQKVSSIALMAKLDAVIHNSGMPDFVKMQNSEFMKQYLRQKAFDKVGSAIGQSSWMKGFQTRMKAHTESLKGVMGSVNMGIEASQSMKDMGIDQGGIAGGLIGDHVGSWIENWVAKQIGNKAKDNDKVKYAAALIRNLQATAYARGKDFAYSPADVEQLEGILGKPGFKQVSKLFLKGAKLIAREGYLGAKANETTKLSMGTSLADMNNQGLYTKQTDNTINRVIPGYLKLIHRELSISRLGPNAPAMAYDIKTGQFIPDKQMRESLGKGVVSDQDITRTSRQFIKAAGRDGMRALQGLDRADLAKLQAAVLKGHREGRQIDADYLGSKEVISQFDPAKQELVRNAAKMFFDPEKGTKTKLNHERLKLDRRSAIAEAAGASASRMSGSITEIQAQIDAGHGQHYIDMGVVKPDGTLDPNAIIDRMSGVTSTSDIFAKKNIKSWNPKQALNKLGSLKFGSWDYKKGKGDGKSHFGPMAQNVQRTLGNSVAPGGTAINANEMASYAMASVQGLAEQQEALERSLKSQDSKGGKLSMKDHLENIEKILISINAKSGIGLNMDLNGLKGVAGQAHNQASQQVDKAMAAAQRAAQKTKGFFDPTKFDTSSMTGSMAAMGAHVGNHAISGATNMMARAQGVGVKLKDWWDQPSTWPGVVRNKMGQFRQNVADRWEKVQDMYVAGEKSPRIFAVGIKNGLYIDVNTGKRLKSLKDITGDVMDIKSSQIVLKADELDLTYVRPSLVEKGKKLGKGFFDKATDLVGKVKDNINHVVPIAYTAAVKGLHSVVSAAMGMMDEAKDVYVRGEKEPRLLKIKMLNGHYYDPETKTSIAVPSDIKGMVQDKDGKVVLTKEDILKGLVDSEGKAILSRSNLVRDLGKRAMLKASELAGRGLKGSLKFLGGIKNAFKGGWNKLTSGFDFGFGIYNVSMNETLTQIRDLLNERLPGGKRKFNDKDGDGIRDGSWQDKMRRGKKGGEPTTAKDKKEKEKKEGGWLGKVLMAFTGLKTMLGMGFKFVGGTILKLIPGLGKLLGMGGMLSGGGKLAGAANLASKFIPGGKLAKMALAGAAGYGGYKLLSGGDAQAAEIGEDGQPVQAGEGGESGGTSMLGNIASTAADFLLPGIGAWGVGKLLGRNKGGPDAGDIADAATSGGKKSLLGKAARGGWGIMKSGARGVMGAGQLAGKALGLGGKAAQAVGPSAARGATSLAGKALNLGGRIMGSGFRGVGAAGRVAMGAARLLPFAGSALGAVGSGLGALAGVVFSPVGLTVLAAGALAYGGYKLYKHLTRRKFNEVELLRFGQYGLAPNDTDLRGPILEVEKILTPLLSKGPNGVQIKEGKLDMNALLKPFDLDENSPEKNLERWSIWFQERFKPVFLSHMTAFSRIKDNLNPEEINKLDAEQCFKMFQDVATPNGPYEVTELPFKDASKSVMTTRNVVKLIEQLDKALRERVAGDGKKKVKKLGGDGGMVDMMLARYGIKTNATVDANEFGQDTLGGQKSKTADVVNKAIKQEVLKAGGSKAASGLKTESERTSDWYSNKKVPAHDAARFSAYGLVELEAPMVASLRWLENYCLQYTRVNAAGQGVFDGDVQDIFSKAQRFFGVASTNSAQTKAWVSWFGKRFLPIYTMHIAAVAKATGSMDVRTALTSYRGTDQVTLDTMNAMKASRVWSETAPAWPDYEMNTNAESIQTYIDFVKNKIKTEKLLTDKMPGKQDDNQMQAAGAKKQQERAEQAKRQDEAQKAALMNKYGMSFGGNTNMKQMVDDVNKERQQQDPNVGSDAPEDPKLGAGGGGGKPSSSAQNMVEQSMAQGTASKPVASGNASAPPMAGGELKDGSGASKYIKLASSGVKLAGLNPAFSKLMMAAIQEYGEKTGKSVQINDGFRTYQDQVAMKAKYGKRAATPGHSLHESGFAIDINSADANAMEKLGLFKKYGLTRPVGGEPWHVEPAGIQKDFKYFVKNKEAATAAIQAGIGKGGGGYGTVPSAAKYRRNLQMATQLLNMPADPTVKEDAEKRSGDVMPPSGAVTPAGKKAEGGAGGGMAGAGSAAGGQVSNAQALDASTSAEAGPKAGVSGGGAKGNAQAAAQDAMATTGARSPSPSQGAAGALSGKGTGGKYSEMAQANGNRGYAAFKDVIRDAAKIVGVDENMLASMAGIESSFRNDASAKTSSAKGMYQFVGDTWTMMMNKYAKKYGIPPGTSPYDPRANALLGAQYVKDNLVTIKKSNPNPTGLDVYMAHFLGPGGYTQFMGLADNAIAAQAMPKAAKANYSIFYDGKTARTKAGVLQEIARRLNNSNKAHGINSNPGSTNVAGNGGEGMDSGARSPAPAKPGAASAPQTPPGGALSVDGASSGGKPSLLPKIAPEPSYGSNVPQTMQHTSSTTETVRDVPRPRAIPQVQPQIQNEVAAQDQAYKAMTGILTQQLDVQRKMLEALLAGNRSAPGQKGSGNAPSLGDLPSERGVTESDLTSKYRPDRSAKNVPDSRVSMKTKYPS